METDKRKEVISTFLDTFAANGLEDTTSRHLAKALNLQSGGLYYYFESKDAAVVACAQEAISRFERIILSALREIESPEAMIINAQRRGDEIAPSMRFLVQVCASPKYAPLLKQDMDTLFGRCVRYAEKAALKLECEYGEIAPYIFMGITVIWHYMLFGKQEYVALQAKTVKDELIRLRMKANGHGAFINEK